MSKHIITVGKDTSDQYNGILPDCQKSCFQISSISAGSNVFLVRKWPRKSEWSFPGHMPGAPQLPLKLNGRPSLPCIRSSGWSVGGIGNPQFRIGSGMFAVCLTSVASARMSVSFMRWSWQYFLVASFAKAFRASSSEPTLGAKDCLLAKLLFIKLTLPYSQTRVDGWIKCGLIVGFWAAF